MRTHFQPSDRLSDFFSALEAFKADPEVKSILVFAADGNDWKPEAFIQQIGIEETPIFGGVFPRVLFEAVSYETGFILLGLPSAVDISVVEGLSDTAVDFDSRVMPIAREWADLPGPQTLLVLADALSTRIAALVKSLFYCFGLDSNFIGGGAGSLSFEQKPCLFCSEGLIMDAALLVRLPLHSGIGVAHGWEPVSEVMKVTESEGTRIQTLDWEPAYSCYRRMVEAHSGQQFNESNFFDIAKGYPFGIGKLGGEAVVRDPLQANEAEELVCVGEVPKGSFVRILHGTSESLVNAAAKSFALSQESYPAGAPRPGLALFIDCISRALFLEERLAEELAEVKPDSFPLIGAMTLGEIANSGKDYLEFYNKTAVMCLLGTADVENG
jgi:hypothetical protein